MTKDLPSLVRFLQTDQSPYEILDGSPYLFLLAPVNWKIEGIVINTFVLLLAISVPAFQCYLLSLLLMRVKDISTETDASKDPRNLAFAIIFLALKVIAHIFQGLELMAMTFYYYPKRVEDFWRPRLFFIGLIELGVSAMCIAVGFYTYQQQTMMDFSNAITQILVAFSVESVDEQAFDAFQAIMSPTLYRETIESIKERLGPKEVFSEEQKEKILELATQPAAAAEGEQ